MISELKSSSSGEKIIKIMSSEMEFPAFWEYVVISASINCHKVTS
jgi:hypothetical protein